MSTPPANTGRRIPMTRLQLASPRSLAVYDSYEDAQHAVDYLSDHGFAVENVMIVGTDLRQVERVTGRMSLGKALLGGAASGMWLGLMVGLLMGVFVGGGLSWPSVASAVLAGAVFFTIWAGIGYAFTQGKRDFTSVSQVIATRYEILVEGGVFNEANGILRGGAARSDAPDVRDVPDGTGATDVSGSSSAAPQRPRD